MTIQASEHGPPQNKLGYKLLANCLKEHGDEIASKITQIRDKNETGEETQVFESMGQKKSEPMQSRVVETNKIASFPSSVNKELFSKLFVYLFYLGKSLTTKITPFFMSDNHRNIKLHVGNLPFDSTEQDIENLVRGCGQLRFCAIRKHPETKKSKGYAHLEYKYEVECVEAFKTLLGKEIKGRILRIDWCDDIYRKKYPELVAAAAAVCPKSGSENLSDIPPPSPPYDDTNSHIPHNRVQLIDNKGHVTPYGLELAQKMDMNYIYNLVSRIYKLSQRTPSVARALLMDNPSACHVLLQAQSLLGNTPIDLDLESKSHVDSSSISLSKALDYFVNID